VRFEVVHLPAYGPFTDASLDLTGGQQKLEIVYGPNEAGKSSLLRALSDFLFGIPGQTHDDFVHAYKSLRIRVSIERRGERLECVRRKANTNSLRAADDEALIADELFRSFVPLDSRNSFEMMFGLDAERLRQGGEELLQGRNEFGQLLFSAAAGIEGLHDVLGNLNSEAEKLFKPRARATEIAQTLSHLKESKEQLRRAQVSLTDWNKLQDEHQNAVDEVHRLEADIRARQAETEQLKRIHMALPLLRRRADLQEQFRGVESAKVLRDGFASDHQKAVAGLLLKTSEVRESTRRVEELSKAVGAIVLPAELLTREQEILDLHQDAGAQKKGAKDQHRLETELRGAESMMASHLLELGEPPDISRVLELVVPVAEKRLVQDLATTRASLDAELSSGEESLASEKRKLESARSQLAGLAPANPVAPLRTAVRKALQATTSEEKARNLQQASNEENQKIQEDARALPWSLDVRLLENSDLPAEELVAEWTSRLDKTEQAVEHAQARLQDAQDQLSAKENGLRMLVAGRSVPTPAQLTELRQHRDLGWRAVRRSWLESVDDSAEARQFLPESTNRDSLAAAYEDSVVQSDETADRLSNEADQVAKLEQARADIEGACKDASAREVELEECVTKRSRLTAEWEALWTPFEIPARAPRQMSTWLQRRSSILTRLRAVRGNENEARDLLAKAGTAMEELQRCLAEIGENGTPISPSLAGWCSLAEQMVERQDNLTKQRERLTAQVQESEVALAATEARVNKARAGLEDWQTRWAAVMDRLRLAPDADPAAVQDVIRVREELSAQSQTASDRTNRIEGIARDRSVFLEQVRALLEVVAPELLSMPELDAVGKLHGRLSQTKQQQELRHGKEKDLEREQKTLATAEHHSKQEESRLAALTAEAQCETPDDLPALIEKSAQRGDLAARLQEIEEQLTAAAGGRSVAELEDEARGADPDQIPGQLESIERDLEGFRASLKSAEETRIKLQSDLKRMEEASDTCTASADAEAHKARVIELTEEYVRLQLSRIVLQGAVDQYREKTQGDMLNRSSELFSLLTENSFSGLKLDWDEAGAVALVGVRSNTGDHVSLDGMSDGTRDQLYLALRLSSMELYAHDHEPIPFVADDILINFDNARTVAALGALAHLAKHTQVLLFTHHQHLVDLAKETLPADQLAISEIACQIGVPRPVLPVS
jgi:uncharacterized protein YhaN